MLSKHYGFETVRKDEDEIEFSIQVLREIAEKRALIKKGGDADIDKASLLVLDDFKNGRLGKMTLENAGVL